MSLPKVSCILPVGYGDKYFQVALNAFLDQNYDGELELIICDNSDEPIESLLPSDPRIKYFRTALKEVGALRNLGTSYATGDICVTWDEDDWSHPQRVAEQVGRLLGTGKSVTGWHSIYYYDTGDGSTYKYWYDPSGKPHPPYACGTSQCYTRSWWQKHPFPSVGIEDTDFAREARNANQLDSCDASELVVARAHNDSVCPPAQYLGSHRQFPSVPKDELPKEFYAAIKTATPAPTKTKKATKEK